MDTTNITRDDEAWIRDFCSDYGSHPRPEDIEYGLLMFAQYMGADYEPEAIADLTDHDRTIIAKFVLNGSEGWVWDVDVRGNYHPFPPYDMRAESFSVDDRE